MLVLASTTAFAQKTHVITLNVDTGYLTDKNADQVSNFGQNKRTSNKDFTTTVKIGDVVKWRGISSRDKNHRVLIKSINYESGARILSNSVINGKSGMVTTVINSGKPGDVQKYKVLFTVMINGRATDKVYIIDPKIRIGV